MKPKNQNPKNNNSSDDMFLRDEDVVIREEYLEDYVDENYDYYDEYDFDISDDEYYGGEYR